MNAPLPVGAGAMLARLVGLGRRCGLQPEAVLLHVLDGAPLPDSVVATVGTSLNASDLDRIKTEVEGAIGAPVVYDEPDPAWLRKGDRAVHFYGTTALSNPAIGRLIESTPHTVSWFIRKARDRGDPLVAAGDRMRGRLEISREESEALARGFAADRVLHLWANTDLDYQSIAAEAEIGIDSVYDMIREGQGDARFDAGYARRDILAERPGAEAPQTQDEREFGDDLVFEIPERDPALSEDEQERLDQLNEASLATRTDDSGPQIALAMARPERLAPGEVKLFDASGRVLKVTPEGSAIEAQAVSIGAPPAPALEPPASKAEQAVALWASTELSYVEIAHEIGSTQASVYERIRQAKKRGDKRWGEGFARRNPSTGSQPEVANGEGEHEIAQQHEQDATLAATGEPAGETRQGDDPVATRIRPIRPTKRPWW